MTDKQQEMLSDVLELVEKEYYDRMDEMTDEEKALIQKIRDIVLRYESL